MATKAVVDALYERTATLLVGPKERPMAVPRDSLPPDVQEGDVVRIAEGAATLRRLARALDAGPPESAPGPSLRVDPDQGETQKRRSAIRGINAKLAGRQESQ